MAQSPDGRQPTPGTVFGGTSPDGLQNAPNEFGAWVKGPTNQSNGSFSWMWLPMQGPGAPTDTYVRSTPGVSQSIPAPALANPISFSNPGVGASTPNAGKPISVTGSSGSTGNPTVDLNRKIVGTVPGGGPVFSNPA